MIIQYKNKLLKFKNAIQNKKERAKRLFQHKTTANKPNYSNKKVY
jgi:hypothetical protein